MTRAQVRVFRAPRNNGGGRLEDMGVHSLVMTRVSLGSPSLQSYGVASCKLVNVDRKVDVVYVGNHAYVVRPGPKETLEVVIQHDDPFTAEPSYPCRECGGTLRPTGVQWFAHSLEPQDLTNCCTLEEYKCGDCARSVFE